MKKSDYIKTIQDMHMPDDMRARIAHRMARENGHKEVPISMFKHKKKRMAAAVIAATVVVGGSAFAFGGTAISQIIARCSASADYTSLPSAQQCQQDAGFTPALLQSFDNGFAFKDGVIVHNQEQNEDGQTIRKVTRSSRSCRTAVLLRRRQAAASHRRTVFPTTRQQRLKNMCRTLIR